MLSFALYEGSIGFAGIWAQSDNPTALAPRATEMSSNIYIPYSQFWFDKTKLSGGVVAPSETAGELVRLTERCIGGMIMTADVGIEEPLKFYIRFERWEEI
jgi:hypothetical protein